MFVLGKLLFRFHRINRSLQLFHALLSRATKFDEVRAILFRHRVVSTFTINLFEDRIHFVAVCVIDWPDSVRLHFHRPLCRLWHESQNVQMIQRFPHSRNHASDEGVVDICRALVGGVLGICEIVDRRAIENHIISRIGIAVNATDVVIQLDSILQFG